jgi:hypothetical protein
MCIQDILQSNTMVCCIFFLPKNVGMYFIYLNSSEAQLGLKLNQKLV